MRVATIATLFRHSYRLISPIKWTNDRVWSRGKHVQQKKEGKTETRRGRNTENSTWRTGTRGREEPLSEDLRGVLPFIRRTLVGRAEIARLDRAN